VSHTLAQSYESVKLSALSLHPDNPRQGDVGVIHESIKENGFYGALIVQKSSMRILAGNHRVQAAKAAGMTEVPAIVLDVDDATAQRILLVDNRSNDLASYDEAALAGLLLSMDDLAGTGYTLDDLDALRAKLDEPLVLDPPPGEDESSQLGEGFHVLVTCRDEVHQAQLLERFMAEGLHCKAMVV
jgi:ParB-like chromosome segregation protein Spo0J